MFMSESAAKLLAPYAGPWKEPQVRHFLNRTGFSATTAEVETALQAPLAALVRRRVHYESAADSYPPPGWATAPTAAQIAEIPMIGIITLRLGRPIEWDSAAMKVKGAPEADRLINREHRSKWL